MRKVIFTLSLLCCCISLFAQTPVFHLKYNELNGTTTTKEEISGLQLPISNQFNRPERVTGVTGTALRTDGFSTWISTTKNLGLATSFTLETWLVIEAFPADKENIQYSQLTPSAIISQTDGNNGFAMFMNSFGKWNITVTINGAKKVLQAPNSFPLYQWSHVVATLDGPSATLRLYLNGVQVASMSTGAVNGTINQSGNPLIIGKSNIDKTDNIHILNAMNGTYDDTKIYTTALSAAAISTTYTNGTNTITTSGEQAIAVNASRFSTDPQRPKYHAMPPANWTNEPHGLTLVNGVYHMFYQRTPNGTFKEQMHWGHMTSTNLINWTNSTDALWPELNWTATTGYDEKGIWSGDVIMNGTTAHAFYTCVNNSGSLFNPGIGHATSDVNLKNWNKTNPVIDHNNVADVRDPYIFKDGATWVMLIGAKATGSAQYWGGSLVCYTSTDLVTWTYKPDFCTVPYDQMDIGSELWEMPVFESIGNGKHILIANPIGGVGMNKWGVPAGTKAVRGVYWIGTYSGGRFTPDLNNGNYKPKNLDLIVGHLSPTVERKLNGVLTGMGIVDERTHGDYQKANGWCHTFSLPRVYSLLADNKTLGQAPAPEAVALRTNPQTLTNINVNGTYNVPVTNGASMELMASLNPATTATKYGVHIRKSADGAEITRIYYENGNIIVDKTNSSLNAKVEIEDKVLITQPYDVAAFGKPESFHVFIDNSIIDVFINEKAAFSARIYPTKSDSQEIELFSEGGITTFTSVNTWTTAVVNIPVTSVTLNKTSTSIAAGRTETLVETVLPATATNKNVTWTSSNTAVANVINGVVCGVASGTAIITVTTQDGAKVANCTVTVTPQTYVKYNFETGNLTGWTTTGTAFTNAQVTQDATYWEGQPFNQQGLWHLWGFKNQLNDTPVGDMKTANFTLGGDGLITFKVGGGNIPDSLHVGLYNSTGTLLGSKVTGSNDEGYTVKSINGAAYVGQTCYIKVVDIAKGGFGHINVDDFKIPIASTTVNPTSVSLNKTTTSMVVGMSETLIATVLPTNATNKAVNWSSSNTAVATVNAVGVVTGVGVGTATITVTTQVGAKTATCSVTVTAQSYLVYDFESENLNGWTIVSGNAFSNARVTNDATFWGGPFGQQGAWHLWGFKNATDDTPTGVMKTTSNFTLTGNGQITLMIAGGNDINNIYIALCNAAGTELVKATGTNNEAYTTITLNGAAYVGTSCYLKVVDNATGGFGHINLDNIRIPSNTTNVAVISVALNKATTTLIVNQSETLTETINPANATNKTVTWSSNNSAVASVNNNGVITAVAPGTARITVTTQDGNKTAFCDVTVVAQSYLVYDFESGNLAGWTIVSGNAFSNARVANDISYWGGPFNQQGTWHLWGFKNATDDTPVGVMKTANFMLSGNGQISLMIAGGNDIANVYIALCNAAGTELVKATGTNNEAYTSVTLNGAAYVGTSCYLKVVDNSAVGFGHINLDNIRIPTPPTINVISVALNKSTTTLITGNTEALIATINPANATNQVVSWSSNNTAVATVNASGLVTAIAAGTARITVTTQDGAKIAFCDVTVITQPYLTYNFESGTLNGWTVVSGTAFGANRIANETTFWGGPFNHQGTYHLWGFKNATDDTPIGVMKTTSNFTLSGNGLISLMIAGGNDLTNIYIALCNAAGTELVKATGTNNEAYTTINLNGSAYIGTSCYLKVVDNSGAGFGHINLDNIVIPVAAGQGGAMMAGPTTLMTTSVETEVNSFQEITSPNAISLYPMPVLDNFTLDLSSLKDEDYQMQIVDLNGRTIYKAKVKGNIRHDFSARELNMVNHLYILNVSGSNYSKSFKILLRDN